MRKAEGAVETGDMKPGWVLCECTVWAHGYIGQWVMCIGLPKDRGEGNTAPATDCIANGEPSSDKESCPFMASKVPVLDTTGECSWAKHFTPGGVLPSRPYGDIIM